MGHRGRLVVVLLAVLALATPRNAWAHASLIHANPGDGAVLATAPSRLVLHFNEPVTPLLARVIDAAGHARTLELPAAADVLSFAAPALPAGSYALSWRVVSEDGHPVGGSILFSIGGPSAGPVAMADAPDTAARVLLWLARLAMACALTFGVGGVVVRRVFSDDRDRPSWPLAAVLLAGLAGSALLPGLQGLDALDLPWTSLSQAIAWRTGASTSFGATAGLAALACLAALAAMAARGRAGTVLAVLAMGAAILGPAASGHAASASPRALTTPAVVLHVLAAGLWLGALVTLATAFCRGSSALEVLRRLSRLLPLCVAGLVASGLALAVVQLGSPSALVDTAYGRVLSTKLVLVLVLLAVAAANRWLWTAPALAGDGPAGRKLSRAVVAEILLGVAILAVVGLWRFTPPPRVLAAERAAPASIHLHTAQAMADVTLSPGRAGPMEASIGIMTGDFGPLDAKEVSIALSRPDLGLEPIERAASKDADGVWRVGGLSLPVPGRWTLQVRVLVDDFHLARLDGEVTVKP